MIVSRIFLYLSFKYLKIFSVIFVGLILFYVGFDYLSATKWLPESANIRTLYIYYNAQFASDILLPLALVFSMIATKLLLIRSNELVAFYSIGYTKWQILRPFVYVSTVITLTFIFAHTTKYAYAKEYVASISDKGSLSRTTEDLFFKYKDYYVYFQTLHPVAKKAKNLRIFHEKNRDVVEIIRAKEAYYRDDKWYIPHASKFLKESEIEFEERVAEVFDDKSIEILEGFKPEILDHIHQGKVTYSIMDAVEAITLLDEQNSNADKVYTALYTMVIYPLFAPALILIIFFFVPISSRSLNVSLFSFLALLVTLMTWGILFLLRRLTQGGLFLPEVGIIAPVVFIFLVSVIVWLKKAR
jgi:lipopolysaccharide export system permease protein